MTIRVLIADDHGMLRQGIHAYLALNPEIEVVGEAADGSQAVRLAGELRPDVVLMDLLMPGVDGIAATRIIRRDLPDTQVVAVTSVLENGSVAEAIRAGATGYVLKDADPEELCRAVTAAAAGQVRLSPAALTKLAHAVREVRAPAGPETLTEREIDILRLIAHGHSNKEIARCLDISEKTVKNHVANILDKLDVASRTQAALFAVHMGLVPAGQQRSADPLAL